MNLEHNLNQLLEEAGLAENHSRLEQLCGDFCRHNVFDHFLLYGCVFTSLLTPPSYIIHSPGKAARLKNKGLREIIHDCLITSTPLVTGNIATDSIIHNSIFNVKRIPHSKSLSICFPVHFPQGKFAMLYISTSLDKQAVDDKVINCLAGGHQFARAAGGSIIRLLETELNNKPPYLSQREKECLLMASEGATPRAISEAMGLSSHTIIFYLKKAREKLHSKNIQSAVGRAILSGDISTRIGSEKN